MSAPHTFDPQQYACEYTYEYAHRYFVYEEAR